VTANVLIGLREGLEAALLVGILVAYLVKSGHRDRLPAVWAGVATAVALSVGVGAVLTFTSGRLSFEAQEAFGGVTSLVAVAFVTWMVFWMQRAARTLKDDLHGQLDTALGVGTFALAATAFLAVGREGIETALFLWSAIQATGSTTSPLLGALTGLGLAVVLGWLLYRRAVTINLARFFRWTGVALVVVAAGVLAYGVHDLQEAAILPGLASHPFDVSGTIAPSSWVGTVLKGAFNFNPTPSWLEFLAWSTYLAVVLPLFVWRMQAGQQPVPAASSSSLPTPAVPRSH
jgi:high-affinity iron transporter